MTLTPKRTSYVLLPLVMTACVFAACYGYIIWQQTVMALWVPIVVALAAGIATMLCCGWCKYISGSAARCENVLCNIVVVGCIVFAGIILLNYNPDADSQPIEVTVLAKHTKHAKAKTPPTDTHRYVERAKKNKYTLTVQLPDEYHFFTKTLYVDGLTYYHAKTGQPLTLTARTGRLGFLVFDKEQ